MNTTLKRLFFALCRKQAPIQFVNHFRTMPISQTFGYDRGTPIDRFYISNFLDKQRTFIAGRVLEVSSDHYSRLYGDSRVEAFEVLHATSDNKNATIIGNLTDIANLPESSFDCFICTQTFNFIYDVQKAIEGSYKILKDGGVLLATVSGISQISRYDMDRWGDYWRFTTLSIQRLFQPVFGEGVVVESYGNALAATALIQGIAVEDLPKPALLNVSDPNYQVLITIVAQKATSC